MIESRREANKRKCRQEILKASRRLFKEKGYENTMIEDVADKARFSKATIYNYFPNKESLLLGTMEEVIEAFGKCLEGLDDTMTSYEKIKRAMTFLVLDSIPFIGISRRILFLNSNEESPLYQKARPVYDVLFNMVEEAKKEGEFREDLDTKVIVEMIMGVYLNSQFRWSDIERITPQECAERIDYLMELVLSGCFSENRGN